MSRINYFLIILCGAFLFTSCHPKESDNRSILIYVAADNSLSSFAEDCLEDLTEGFIPIDKEGADVLLVYSKLSGGIPTLSRYYKDSKGSLQKKVLFTYDQSQNSASASVIAQVLSDAENAYPAKKHGLILWSHGTGWLPQGYYSHPVESTYTTQSETLDPYRDIVKSDQKSFAQEGDSEMEIEALAHALTLKYEFILFDCCLMGGIEVAYELREKCDYLLFSPTEILAESFPYYSMMDALYNYENREEALRKICEDYFNYYQSQSGIYQSATVSMIKTSQLKPLATACAAIFKNNRSKMDTVDVNAIQPYFRYNKHWFYDLDDYISRLASKSEYATFTSALNSAIVYKAATEHFLDIDISKYSGLSTYISDPDFSYLNLYYKNLQWNIAVKMVQ